MGRDDLKALLHYLSTNRSALWALQSGDREVFNEEVREGARRCNVKLRDNAEPVRLIGTWATNASCPEVLKSALAEYRRHRQQARRQRMTFLTRTRLYISPGLQIRKRSTIRIVAVKTTKSSYPPYGTIIADTREIYNKWYPHFIHGKQADSRLKRLPLQILDVNRLQMDIEPSESVVIKDENGHLLGFVLRNFCPDERLLQWATQVANMQIPVRRNIRKEDTGKLVLMGYSAGSRSKTAFDWVRNITRKMTDEQKVTSDMAGSVLFAVAWQLMKSQVPQEVIDDFNDFVKSLAIRRMDKGADATSWEGDNGGRDRGEGKVKVSILGVQEGKGRLGVAVGEEEFEFDNVELAPPSGVLGQNYSRWGYTSRTPPAQMGGIVDDAQDSEC
ncbi:hypothetical protein H0H93_007413 [Arthromyces matolae]|nr:hypothetical protein H0H93_007413 [Arthromyces matolae]